MDGQITDTKFERSVVLLQCVDVGALERVELVQHRLNDLLVRVLSFEIGYHLFERCLEFCLALLALAVQALCIPVVADAAMVRRFGAVNERVALVLEKVCKTLDELVTQLADALRLKVFVEI